MFDDPHIRHRDLVLKARHGSGVDVPLLRSPLRLSEAPVEHRAPPMLGEHTEDVLREKLGLSGEQIAQLRTSRIV